MKWKNERGFTLVEILASLTILGIVFISFMTIFPQMVSVNDRTETKLQTMNSAKVELINLKKNPSKLIINEKIKNSISTNDYETYTWLGKHNNVVEIDCYNVNGQTCSGIGEDTASRQKELYKIHIRVKVSENTISETFGYVELD
ncbi:hypothetical protein CSV80_06030 [Sporosarcina sp. P12(2017)]|uniref:PulJ/GspJ family protein n=1 Tax=unclassified Sporosarcina TaxID=2647733 RepID=UPI000C164DD8|nr:MULTISPECIES: type II secretion system protein [unclassified Sporosarcina]PIC57867.1 hypothetical protein CSV81_06175 [Sporosarcina sp. P10]PIC61249.1 hypothetical protein CSV80_06030 [Sporosarcina sp. P12(2017)]